jgi:iron complex outermembrane recepter protein
MRFLKSFVVLQLCIIVSVGVSAQRVRQISGAAKDSAGNAISGATVTLFRSRDSSLAKIAISDDKGNFEFENIKGTSFYLTVSAIGFKRYTSQTISPVGDSASLSLPAILLAAGKSVRLKDVTVGAKKPFVEQRIDMIIVNVEALISSAGTNALEMLEKSPGVSVVNETIQLKGKTGVMIFIDGRPTYLSVTDLANYLKTIPSSQIDRIEIMTNPPAKYDAAGTAGVINIVLKKVNKQGFNASLTSSYGQGVYHRLNNNLVFNYKTGNINLFGGAGYNITQDFQVTDVVREFMNSNGSLAELFTQNSFVKMIRKPASLRVGLDYNVSKKTIIGFVVSGLSTPASDNGYNTSYVRNGKLGIDSIVTGQTQDHSKWQNGSVNLNLSHQFKSPGTSLNVNLDVIGYKLSRSQLFTTVAADSADEVTSGTGISGALYNHITVYSGKADYSHPLKDGSRLDAGIKSSYVNTNNTADYYDIFGNTELEDYGKTNAFIYKENINAVYINWKRDFKRLSAQAGLRLENTNSNGDQLGNAVVPDSSFKRSYTDLFPTAYISYKLDSNSNQLTLNYGRRINRPLYQDLNPFLTYVDNFFYESGNPFLNPSISNQVELSHSYKNKIITTLSYSYLIDNLDETIQEEGNVLISRTGNVGKQINMGASVNANLNLAKWWALSLYGGVTNTTIKNNFFGDYLDYNQTSFMGNIVNQFVISKDWSAELSGFGRTKSISSQFTLQGVWQVSGGVQKTIFKGNGTLRFNARDIFLSMVLKGQINGLQGLDASFADHRDTRVLNLSFSYRFGKSGNNRQRNRGGAADEQNRIKSSN